MTQATREILEDSVQDGNTPLEEALAKAVLDLDTHVQYLESLLEEEFGI